MPGPACKVGDRARDAQHPVVRAGRQSQLAHGARQQFERRRISAALDGQVIAFEPGVGARLRPVLMTTLATATGAVPLMLASGAGAESRQSIGATVFFGSVFAVALTLIVVPALYVLIARNTRSPQHLSRIIDKLRGSRPVEAPLEGDPAPQPDHA